MEDLNKLLEEYDKTYIELMKISDKTKCSHCKCWVVNVKAHNKTKKHYKNLMNILN